jgi:hypothetical protein
VIHLSPFRNSEGIKIKSEAQLSKKSLHFHADVKHWAGLEIPRRLIRTSACTRESVSTQFGGPRDPDSFESCTSETLMNSKTQRILMFYFLVQFGESIAGLILFVKPILS